jgi:hypothetical protein
MASQQPQNKHTKHWHTFPCCTINGGAIYAPFYLLCKRLPTYRKKIMENIGSSSEQFLPILWQHFVTFFLVSDFGKEFFRLFGHTTFFLAASQSRSLKPIPPCWRLVNSRDSSMKSLLSFNVLMHIYSREKYCTKHPRRMQNCATKTSSVKT